MSEPAMNLSPAALSVAVAFVTTLLASCSSYQGAVYTSHQAFGLGVHTAAEGPAPVKLNFGYDHAVGALVPRRGYDTVADEATSLISKDNIQTVINPDKSMLSRDKVLQVDSALITGTAAIIATLPAGSTAAVSEDGVEHSFVVRGTPGQRISTALQLGTARLSTAQLQMLATTQAVTELDPARKDGVYRDAAKNLPEAFQQFFNNDLKKNDNDAVVAFDEATARFVEAGPDDDSRLNEVQQALEQARKGH